MDSVDGTPYIAWNEPSGRTLDVLLEKCRSDRAPPSRRARAPDRGEGRDRARPRLQHDGRRGPHAAWARLPAARRHLGRRRDPSLGLRSRGGRAAVDRPASPRGRGGPLPRVRGARAGRSRTELGRLLGRRDPVGAAHRRAAAAGRARGSEGPGQRAGAAGAPGDPGAAAHDARSGGCALQVERRSEARAGKAALLGAVFAVDLQPRLLPKRPLPRRDRARDSRAHARSGHGGLRSGYRTGAARRRPASPAAAARRVGAARGASGHRARADGARHLAALAHRPADRSRRGGPRSPAACS
jgi:hypothetical protein